MDGSLKGLNSESTWIVEVSSFEWYTNLSILSCYPQKLAFTNSERQLLTASRNLLYDNLQAVGHILFAADV